jgi:hypothetical protein
MPSLAFTDFNIACATLGGFVSLFGLVSYLCKETLFLSEARKLRIYTFSNRRLHLAFKQELTLTSLQ